MLPGTVSVVSGGSSGIGRAVVERFVEHGSAVEFAANDEAGVAALQAELEGDGVFVRGSVLDASDAAQVEAFMRGVAERHGRLDALVNSAGIQRYGTVESTSLETWDEVMAVNLRSMFLMAKHAVPLLRANGGGAIVNVSSVQAIASQAMTRARAIDPAKEGIRVNSVCPGSVDTPMLRASARDIDPEHPDRMIAEWGSMHPIGRVGRPGEVADAILYLVSRYSSFVTGADLRVDGGMVAGTGLPAPDDAD
jgi:NAD(P)-dependent dehydrogenase (short-subunit alcohol dehydrogenase family)